MQRPIEKQLQSWVAAADFSSRQKREVAQQNQHPRRFRTDRVVGSSRRWQSIIIDRERNAACIPPVRVARARPAHRVPPRAHVHKSRALTEPPCAHAQPRFTKMDTAASKAFDPQRDSLKVGDDDDAGNPILDKAGLLAAQEQRRAATKNRARALTTAARRAEREGRSKEAAEYAAAVLREKAASLDAETARLQASTAAHNLEKEAMEIEKMKLESRLLHNKQLNDQIAKNIRYALMACASLRVALGYRSNHLPCACHVVSGAGAVIASMSGRAALASKRLSWPHKRLSSPER
jgi:hypothetical protein